MLSAIAIRSERRTGTASFDALAELTVAKFVKACFVHGAAPAIADVPRLVAALEKIGNDVPEFQELDATVRAQIAADFAAKIKEKLASWLVRCGKAPIMLQ